MATKGTYAAYQSTPIVPSGQFAGAGSFSRMAAVEAQKRAEERAEQRRLKAEYRQAITNAIEAGNIDYSQINNSVHGMVGKVLDWYGEKMADFMETMNEDYSFEKQMEVNRLKTEFQSKIGILSGIGQAINQYATGDWDNLLSISSMNQLTNFTKRIPEIANNFDPETFTVNGERIDQYFHKNVDASGFIAPVDSDSLINDWVDDVFSGSVKTEIEEIVGNRKRVYQKENYEDSTAKSSFFRLFKDTLEGDKIKRSILIEHEQIENEQEREEFEANYMYIGDDGEAYVDDEGLYNYLVDNYLEPRSKQLKSEEVYEDPNKLTPKQQRDIQDELLDNQAILRNLQEAASGEIVGLKDHTIYVDGMEGSILGGGLSYNPFTGESAITINYVVDEDGDVKHMVRQYENSEAGLQGLAHDVYRDKVDYRLLKQKVQRDTGNIITEPVVGTTLEDREKAINGIIESYRNTIESVITARKTDEDLRGAAERAFELITEVFPETGEMNKPLANVMAEYLGLNKEGWGYKKPLAKGYGIDKYDLSTKLKSTLDLDKSDKTVESEKIAHVVAMARALKSEGKSDNEIANELVKALNNYDSEEGFVFEFDRVKRKYGSNPQKLNDAKVLLSSGFNDDEIISLLDNKVNIEKIAKKGIESNYSTPVSVDKFWRDIKQYASANNISVIQALKFFKLL